MVYVETYYSWATTIGNYFSIGLQITTQESPTFATTRWSPTRMTVKAFQPSGIQMFSFHVGESFSYTTIFHGFKIQAKHYVFNVYGTVLCTT
jgi:hypothetical protein